MGRPVAERKAIARCYVAKAVLRYPHTRTLIQELQARPNLRLICGFMKQKDVPSESTFFRAFAAFAKTDLCITGHNAMVKEYLGGELIGHVSRDSTAIVGREKADLPKQSNGKHRNQTVWTGNCNRRRERLLLNSPVSVIEV